jgi:hypothetical protein
MERRSFYLHMRDDVKLAVTLLLPKSLPAGERVPTLISQSRYWREMELRPPLDWFVSPDIFVRRLYGYKPFFVRRGYAIVLVDERGTGASYGCWVAPWHSDTLEDSRQVVDWIIAQPWSNGRVGSYGISYLGTTAEQYAALCHPAVRAALPMFNHPDPFLDVGYPGGVFNQRFVRAWDEMSRELDSNHVPAEFGLPARLLLRGVRPVDRDRRRRELRQALLSHNCNTNVFSLGEAISCRDDRMGEVQVSVEDISLERYRNELEQTQTAVFGWGSWMDAGTADAVLRRFAAYPSCQRAVIGAWEHGGTAHSSPYSKPDRLAEPPMEAQWSEMLRFFDAYLKDGAEPLSESVLFYYNLGEETWKRTPVWPPAGTRPQRWHLSRGRQLLPQPPGDETGVDVYEVDFNASTGERNRWWELGGVFGKSVAYPRRAEAAAHLLVYLSPPLERDLQITGHAQIILYLSSSESDGAVYVYLEDVHPDGQVTYLTEGQLRLVHRKPGSEAPPGYSPGYSHTFRREDVLPLVPGQVEEVSFSLLPVAALVRKGHRLRLGIAGHDQGTFVRLPATGNPALSIFRTSLYPSCIEIPVIEE